MGGVSDELALLVPCFFDGSDNPACQQEADKKEDKEAYDADQDTISYQIVQDGQFA